MLPPSPMLSCASRNADTPDGALFGHPRSGVCRLPGNAGSRIHDIPIPGGAVPRLEQMSLSPAHPSLEIGQPDPLPLGLLLAVCAEQHCSLDAGGHGAADKAVEPVVVWVARAELPLVDDPSPGLGPHAILGCDVISKQPVGLAVAAEQRQAAGIAHRHGQAGVDEGFPIVRVDQHVANLALALDVRDSPVVADAVAPFAFVLGERDTRRANKPAVAGHHDGRVRTLAAELIDHNRPWLGITMAECGHWRQN